MSTSRIYPTKAPGESVFCSWEFTRNIPSGVTITGGTVTCAVTVGTDGAAASMPSGAVVITSPDSDGRHFLSRLVGAGLAGNTYALTFTATLSNGETRIGVATLPIR